MKAVILCGGKGTRLQEETRSRPKPLVTVGGFPILTHIIKIYQKAGISEFVFALGYLGDQIKEHYSRNYQQDSLFNSFREQVSIQFIDTGLETMTGGRLLRLKEFLSKDDEFMLTYGDGLSSIDISKVEKFHKSHTKLATVTAVRPPARFGVIKTDEVGRVEYFQEKNQTDAGWINGGFFVLKREIFNYLDDDQTVLEEEPLQKLSLNGELMAFKHNEFWQCMDTLRDREFLEELWNSGKAPWR